MYVWLKYQKHHHPSHHQVFNPINYHLNETKNQIPPITQNIQKKEKKFEVYQRQRFGQTQMNQNKKLNK